MSQILIFVLSREDELLMGTERNVTFE